MRISDWSSDVCSSDLMTDDQSQDALGIYGNKILKTPNMDRIGNEGIRFNKSFVTTSVCAPSRASYLTGLYAHSHGVTSNGEAPGWYEQMGLRPDHLTYPTLLRPAQNGRTACREQGGQA